MPQFGKVEGIKVLAKLFDGQQVFRDVVSFEEPVGCQPGEAQHLREFEVGELVLAVES